MIGMLIRSLSDIPDRSFAAALAPIAVLGVLLTVLVIEKAVFTPPLLDAVRRLLLDNVAFLAALTELLSNVVSNVPAVLVLPFIAHLSDAQQRGSSSPWPRRWPATSRSSARSPT